MPCPKKNFNIYIMTKKKITLPILLLIISFISICFASWSKLEHWENWYYYLFSVIGLTILIAAIILLIKKK